MNRQEVFDKVATHMLKQDKRAMEYNSFTDSETCLYLDGDGNKCAIGCYIPDGHDGQEYRGGVQELLTQFPDLVPLFGLKTNKYDCFDGNDIDFLANLQVIHDKDDPSYWRHKLREFGQRHNLLTTVCDESTCENPTKNDSEATPPSLED